MQSEEFKELKQDILEIRDQLTQLMDLFEMVMPEVKEKEMQNLKNKSSVIEINNDNNGTNEKEEEKIIEKEKEKVIEKEIEKEKEKEKEKIIPTLQKKFSSESLISEISIDDSSVSENNISNTEKYVIKRRNKLKKKRKYDPNFKDIEASHTIITKDVLKDIETKGYSDVKRHVNEEDIKPINDPLHVSILYNFGFVIDSEYNKHNAIILLGSAISHNVIHIKMVEKLRLSIIKVDEPFIVTSSLSRFQSHEYCHLTLAVNLGNIKNRMFKEKFVVSRDDHHNDMVVVCGRTWGMYDLNPVQPFEFEEKEDVIYVL